jgi:hypothetical protein
MAEKVKYRWPQAVDPEQFRDESAVTKNIFHVDYLKTHFRDFARSNLFKVEFNLPPALQDSYNFICKEATNRVEMTAKSINIPAWDVSKQEIKRMGQRLILPATMNTGECQGTFFSDDNYSQRKFLHSWFNHIIYDYDTNSYRRMTNLIPCTMRVYQLDNKFNVVFGIQLNHCFPTSIGEIQFSHDSENQVTEFPVTFAYSTYEILTPDKDNKDE